MRGMVPGMIICWPKASEEASNTVNIAIVARIDAMKLDLGYRSERDPNIGAYAKPINAQRAPLTASTSAAAYPLAPNSARSSSSSS
jgi:hypothetical protein